MKRVIVGLDNGFGQVKAVTNTAREVVFPALVAKALPSLGVTPEHSLVHIKEGDFLVGEVARDFAKATGSEVGGAWIFSTAFKALAFHAFDLLGVRKGLLVTGLSVEYYLDMQIPLAREVEKWGADGYEFRLADTHPQPAGTFWDLAIDQAGNFNPEFTERRVAIVDIGHGTLDLIEIYRSDPTQAHHSTPFGLHTAYLALLQHILVKQSDAFTMADMPTAMRSGSIRVDGAIVKLDRVIEELKTHYAAYVHHEMRQVWPTLDRMDRVVLTGGGAKLIVDHLTKLLKRPKGTVIVPDAADLANARGYVKHAVALNIDEEPAHE